METNKEDTNPSAESLKMGKCPLLPAITGNKRDSGYGTDVNSPASQSSGTSVPRQFVFGSCGTDVDISETLEEMDINDNEDVFPKCDEERHNEASDQNVDDDNDKEVEELFGESCELDHSVSEPIAIQRPQAPIPTPEGIDDARNMGWAPLENSEDTSVSEPLYLNSWTRKDRQRRRFRPIASRNFGTQTPSPKDQEFGQLGPNSKGRSRRPLRLRCESESSGVEEYHQHLPDLIPQPRDRSVSLPSVPSFRMQEQEVGRELRRISDEFNSSFTPFRRVRLSSITVGYLICATVKMIRDSETF
ncbi:uncharacterized protein LOC132745790 isoform X2 [Ruditapes philippinarum]|uniref:uncharacterized protein LOC132745790 isoform X2 n=1 Tax=Ruditapes philippinarum TaxID=129788 RepID=UPI00295B9E09|nr:uncharacterized protein LOC132745790 isoform X2 [Ruditapes philippinarum]